MYFLPDVGDLFIRAYSTEEPYMKDLEGREMYRDGGGGRDYVYRRIRYC